MIFCKPWFFHSAYFEYYFILAYNTLLHSTNNAVFKVVHKKHSYKYLSTCL